MDGRMDEYGAGRFVVVEEAHKLGQCLFRGDQQQLFLELTLCGRCVVCV